ncbi:hypothetical protein B0H13DRAFT_1900664 [Mycena leptocephala]|nr:hypothetical protein B0H13DRAFT_1900664 [Mycena leptocephala]
MHRAASIVRLVGGLQRWLRKMSGKCQAHLRAAISAFNFWARRLQPHVSGVARRLGGYEFISHRSLVNNKIQEQFALSPMHSTRIERALGSLRSLVTGGMCYKLTPPLPALYISMQTPTSFTSQETKQLKYLRYCTKLEGSNAPRTVTEALPFFEATGTTATNLIVTVTTRKKRQRNRRPVTVTVAPLQLGTVYDQAGGLIHCKRGLEWELDIRGYSCHLLPLANINWKTQNRYRRS